VHEQEVQARRTRGRAILARRGVLAGVAAVVAGVLAKAGERVAQAGGAQDSALICGEMNTAISETSLVRSGAGQNANGLYVEHDSTASAGAAVFGNSVQAMGVRGHSGVQDGVHGSTDGSGQGSGTLGLYGSVTRPSGYVAGVLGVAPAGITAVQGVADSPGPVAPQGTAGVGGTSSTGYGVVGSSSSNYGAYGISNNNSGVLGQSNTGVGVQGSANGNVGVLGTSNTSVGVYANSLQQYGLYATSPNNYAAIATSNTGTGVYGTSNGNVGVLGTSNSSIGGFFSSGSSTGLYATGPSSAFAARFDGPVQVNGPFTVLGGPKSAAVPHPDGSHRRLYCVESPESWFEDFGRGQLANGRAQVRLDRDFAALVHGDDYYVFLTPLGNSGGLYVNSKTPAGFEVREQGGGTSDLSFDYRVVARRKDIAGPRLERVELPAAPQRPAAPQPPPTVPMVPPLPDVDAPPHRMPAPAGRER